MKDLPEQYVGNICEYAIDLAEVLETMQPFTDLRWWLDVEHGIGALFFYHESEIEKSFHATPFWEGTPGIPVSIDDGNGYVELNMMCTYRFPVDIRNYISIMRDYLSQ